MPDAIEGVDDAEVLAADEMEQDVSAIEDHRILERTTQSLMQSLVAFPGFEGTGLHVEVAFRRTTVAARKKGGGGGGVKETCALCMTLTYPDGSTTTNCQPVKCPPPKKMPGEP
jgi:hypothetical protein